MASVSTLLRRGNTKLGTDIFWNYVSFGILSVTGLLSDLIIARLHGPVTLGVYHQVFSIYLVASQLAVGGVNYSMLKHAAQYSSDRDTLNRVFSSGLSLTLLCGCVSAGVLYALRSSIQFLLERRSDTIAQGIAMIAPALILFSANKAMLFYLNGLRKMKAFAFFQSLRYSMLLLFIIVISMTGLPGHMVIATFPLAEGVLFLCLLSTILASRSAFIDTPYEFMGMLRVGENATALLGVKGFGGVEKHSAVVTSNAPNWSRRTIRFTTGKNQTSATVFAQKHSGPGVAYVDDLGLQRQ